jgi:hypothetical protein
MSQNSSQHQADPNKPAQHPDNNLPPAPASAGTAHEAAQRGGAR